MARHDEFGKEHLDPTPVSVPAGWARPPTMEELIRRHIRLEMSRQADQAGQETFEEADDFEVDEEPDPLSPYEIPEAAQEWPGGVKPVDPAPPPEPQEKLNLDDPGKPGGLPDQSSADRSVRTTTDNPKTPG